MNKPLNDGKSPSKTSPAPRRRGLTIGEAQKLPHNEHGPDYLSAYHAQWHRPSLRESSHTDTKPRTTQSRPKTYHDTSPKRHTESVSDPESSQKPTLIQKIKVAKDMVKETLQVGKETVGFIRELHKQHRELSDFQQENSQRIHGDNRRGSWRPRVRRSSIEYDSD
ncbi:hypothetical protein LTR84_000746 [Exophiala bonariae]|uniref:Uncharacterized protein n=1 Tax=Exophiala bonariae TaxID=1690606 RepID=A0AAV9NUY3_9EURO|nr:hypothetical protein LTR84_000746 [Exophiala bonariae]